MSLLTLGSGKPRLILVFPCLLGFGLCQPPAGGQPAPGAPPKIVVLEGEGGVNSIRQGSAHELAVQVTDQENRPLAGASVTFVLPATGASATFVDGSKMVTLITDDRGQARVVGMRPNSLEGKFEIRVTAGYQGQMARAVITQTNVPEVAAPVKPSAPSPPAAAKKKGGSGKMIAILVAAVGGGLGAALAAKGGGSKGGGGGGTTTTITTPTIPPPHWNSDCAGAGKRGTPVGTSGNQEVRA